MLAVFYVVVVCGLQRLPFMSNHSAVMPALVAGIHVLLSRSKEGVDGRDKPGHDGAEKCFNMTEIPL